MGLSLVSRFNLEDRLGNFYMIGSMGLASSIALGVALSKPERRVVVFDGGRECADEYGLTGVDRRPAAAQPGPPRL